MEVAAGQNPQPSAKEALGAIGLPMPLQKLSQTAWDAIVVGAGHNGLTCAAYLARAGKRVLVLEARERVGGACTAREPWPGYRVSPCAYLAGLLHPRVMAELNLQAEGFEWIAADASLFVPFDDGSSVQLWGDHCEAEIRRFAPHDLEGWRAMEDVKRRLRDALRPEGDNDLWLGSAPEDETIRNRLDHDSECLGLLFEWSMAEFLERYLEDERLQVALMGQGVIGTNASPFEPGTASIHFHHASGRMGERPGAWGYVKGGMGMVSFLICDVARSCGAVVATNTPVARIVPGQGVELEGGEAIHAPAIVSNADPLTTLDALGPHADGKWAKRVRAIPMRGCTVKLNVALTELPNFRARPGTFEPHHRGQVNTPLTKEEWRSHWETARAGHLPSRLWTELYFQTVCDDGIAPPGKHLMSVFAQYVPYAFQSGDWDAHRAAVADLAIRSIGRYCSNLPRAIEQLEVMGPPDIEREVGLRGGHIFQGECLPPFMWSRRLSPRTPMEGVYLCGACTHPGGSVIAVNGRNAAMAMLDDFGGA